MATYKLIQDIEAEDKILGPLTLRQFIFALISVFLFYMCFIMVIKHVIFLLVIFLPPALFFGFFALPFGRDQPTEVWALAKLRFWFKPRRRIWNQSGVKEMVTITVPKKIEHVYTNGLSQTEVKSRLKALADTIDSRGWATKHVNADAYAQPPVTVGGSDDRLIDINSLPQEVPGDDPTATHDMLDADNNPIARQFDTMINESSRAYRQKLVDQMNDTAVAAAGQGSLSTPANNWFMSRPQPEPAIVPAAVTATPVPAATVDAETEATLAAGLADRASRQVSFGNLRTIQPLSAQPSASSVMPDDFVTYSSAAATAPPDDQATPDVTPAEAMTTPIDPAILSLAKNNDLNLATLAREANKNKGGENQSPNEVVVSLH